MTNGYCHWCPGCDEAHAINTDAPNSVGAKWSFDGNVDKPTFSPSVNIKTNTPDMGAKYQPNACTSVCHYFVKAGEIQFLGDCTHALAGQTVPLPPLPEHLQDG